MSRDAPVIIAGGGWAGLAAALELDRQGIPVTLLESARQLGGRARSVPCDDIVFDNGQHLLIGAYRETLRLLNHLGIDESEVLLRQPLQLEVASGKERLLLSAPPLPAPLHLVWALLSAQGLSSGAKWQAIRMSLGLALSGYRLDKDISVAELLDSYRQPRILVERFWEPLCLATLNTPIQRASAQVFLRVLKDSFTKHREDADLLIPRTPLGALLAEPAAARLLQSERNTIHLRSRVSQLHIDGGRLAGIDVSGERQEASDLILATPATNTAKLLAGHDATSSLGEQLATMGSQPITTVYLHYTEGPPLHRAMLGLAGTVSQWVFDRSVAEQPGWVAVVISTEGEHDDWPREHLAHHVHTELLSNLPGWPAAFDRFQVIREKRATFECRVGIEALRPGTSTPVKGLWLAGDYTATGYPATLEGAVMSGVQCASQIVARRRSCR